ncbi:hypothetical protein HDU76_000483 [Blyttiomyces sp. JEL0837]|nr:hypothetical protein HDU76_000483 [Blyttiomyces sp. JEL0837]
MWIDVFQKIYESMQSGDISEPTVGLEVCMAYVELLKDSFEASNVQVVTTDDKKSQAPGQAPGQGKTAPPGKQAVPKPAASKDNNPSLLKLADEVCNFGLGISNGSYELKMKLFDLKSSLKAISSNVSPQASAGNDSDPVMKLFASLDSLEALKKVGKEDIENVLVDLLKSEKRLSPKMRFELWERLIQHAYKWQQHYLAFVLTEVTFGQLPKSLSLSTSGAKNSPVSNKLNSDLDAGLLCSAELLAGQIIVSMIENGIPYSSEMSMKVDALRRFADSIKYVASVNTGASASVTSALSMIIALLQGINKQKHLQLIIDIVDEITSKFFAAYFANVSFQDSINASPELRDLFLNICEISLELHANKENWQSCIRLLENLFRLMPKDQHRYLWEKKLEILNLSGRGVAVTLLKDASLETQSYMWQKFSARQTDNLRKKEGFEESYRLLKSSASLEQKRVEAGLYFARWLLEEGFDRAQAETVVNETSDCIQRAFSFSPVLGAVHEMYLYVLKASLTDSLHGRQECLLAAQARVLKLIQNLFVQVSTTANAVSTKTIQTEKAKKSKDQPQQPVSEPENFDPPSGDRWFGYEWPNSIIEYFNTTTNSKALARCLLQKPRDLASVLLRIAYGLERLHLLEESLPVLCMLELLCRSYFSDPDPNILQLNVNLLHTQILTKLGRLDAAAKKMQRAALTPGVSILKYLELPWKETSGFGHDLGLSLQPDYLLLLAAKLFLYKKNYPQASQFLALVVSNPGISSFKAASEATYLANIINWLNNSFCESTELWRKRMSIAMQHAKYLIGLTADNPRTKRMHTLTAVGFLRQNLDCFNLGAPQNTFDRVLHQAGTIELCNILDRAAQANDSVSAEEKATLDYLINNHFMSDEEKKALEDWNQLKAGALEEIITRSRNTLSQSITDNRHASKLQYMLHRAESFLNKQNGETFTPPTHGHNNAPSSEISLFKAMRASWKNEDFNTLQLCCEEIISREDLNLQLNDFNKFACLSALQSSMNAILIRDLAAKTIEATVWPRERFLGQDAVATNAAVGTWNPPFRSRLKFMPLSIDMLPEIPKGVKVLVLQHSASLRQLYVGTITRGREAQKSKNPSDDFTVHFLKIDTEEGDLLALKRDLSSAFNAEKMEWNSEFLDRIRQYIGPLLELLYSETKSSSKGAEKADSKKKGAAKVEEPEDVDFGHCVICTDGHLEGFPFDIILRSLKLVSSVSYDFGVTYFLARIKSTQAVLGKKDKEKAEKGGESSFKLYSDNRDTTSLLKIDAGAVDFQSGNLCPNKVLPLVDSSAAACIMAESLLDNLNPSCLGVLVNAPPLLLAMDYTKALKGTGKSTFSTAKKLAAFAYLGGVQCSIVSTQQVELKWCLAFLKSMMKLKDSLAVNAESQTAESLNARRGFYSAPSFQCWGGIATQ